MRIAVLLVGNIRTFDRCVFSFKEFVTNCKTDVFVGTYDLRYGYHPCVKHSVGLIEDELLNPSQVHDMLKPISPCDVRIDTHSEFCNDKMPIIGRGFLPHEYKSLIQFFKLEDALSMMLEHEKNNKIRYDLVIKTRCDLIYQGNIPTTLNFSNNIIVDEGNVFPNDCVIIGNRDIMEKLINKMADICKTTTDRESDATVDIPHGILNLASQSLGYNFLEAPLIRGVMRSNGEIPYPPLASKLRKLS